MEPPILRSGNRCRLLLSPLGTWAILLFLTSCALPTHRPPEKISGLTYDSYRGGAYRFTWIDPEDLDLAYVEFTLKPRDIRVRAEKGREEVYLPVPSHLEPLLLTAVGVNAAGERGDPVHFILMDLRSCSRIEYYDSLGLSVRTAHYSYDSRGKEKGSREEDPSGTLLGDSERTRYDNDGEFSYGETFLADGSFGERRTLALDHRERKISLQVSDADHRLIRRMDVSLPDTGFLDRTIFLDGGGQPLMYRDAAYENNRLSSYSFRDGTTNNILWTEYYGYDIQGRPDRVVTTDGTGGITSYGKYFYD